MLAGRELTFETDGAARHDRAALSILDNLGTALGADGRAGRRLRGDAALRGLLDSDPIRSIAIRYLGEAASPVRAVLFVKRVGTNWTLGWHQDRTVAVRHRIDQPGYGPWTVKSGMTHVEPPFAIIQSMLTIRIHLDDVPADNAPLLVAPGSHGLGKIVESDVETVVRRCGAFACLAAAGDIWAYSTPILHASSPSRTGRGRRVLQIDFAARPLDGALEWLGFGENDL